MSRFLLGVMTMIIANIANADCAAIYNHQIKTLQGKTINLCDYQDKPILVVNTASKCGFTPQFEDLEVMYKKFKPNLLIVGFPSNDFRQELTGDKEIGDFCKNTYKVEFPMATKSSVTGANANPFYKQLIASTQQTPTWNFFKYLILPGGEKVFAFTSDVKPSDPEIMSKIKPYIK